MQKAIVSKSNHLSVEIRINENKMAKEPIKVKKTVIVPHSIGEWPWRPPSQPTDLKLIDKWYTTDENKHS